MGKMFICITVILSICLTISGCNVLKCKEPEQTQPGIVIESNPLNRNIELTMYTGLQTVHDPQRKKMIDDIINELNVLSGSMIGITVRLVYSDSRLSEPLWTDDVPDINIAQGLHRISFSSDMSGFRSYFPHNTLFSYYSSGYIDDISTYINEKTPYLSSFYGKYPAFNEISCLEGKQLGIVVPDYALEAIPVFIVKKSIANQYNKDIITDYETAYDLCKKISKNRTNQSNKVYVSSGSILKWIVQKEGYSNLFSRLIYIYLLKSNDPDHKVYRIDETDLWDQLITVKREIVDNDICTNTQQQLIKDISGNLVDAALFSDVRLLDDLHNNYPALTDEYVILPLYESYKLNSEFYYFTVSKQCEEKQLAVQYIDWLLSNDEARKLIVYGIEGVNYKFDKNTRMIYTDDEVSSMSLAFIGTGTNMMTKGYSILGDISDASYIKDKLLKSFTPSWDVARITQIRNLKEYAEVINEFFNNKNNADKIFNEYNLSRFPSLEMQKIRSDLVMYSFFDEDITIEFLNEFYEKIKDAHDTALIGDMQMIAGYR